jgi:hypothetical protein
MPQSLGKLLLAAGAVLVLLGLLFTFGHKFLPLGKLPGDIMIRRGNFSFYFPVVTCIIISIILTLAFSLFRK